MTNEDEEKSTVVMMAEALDEAKEAFLKYFSDRGYDSGYYDIKFTAYQKDANFEHRLEKVEIEYEVKEKE